MLGCTTERTQPTGAFVDFTLALVSEPVKVAMDNEVFFFFIYECVENSIDIASFQLLNT